jgi:hypothetical protein
VVAAVPGDNARAGVLLDGPIDVHGPGRGGVGEVRRTDNGGRLLVVTWIP